jgi:hypothetical protein
VAPGLQFRLRTEPLRRVPPTKWGSAD